MTTYGNFISFLAIFLISINGVDSLTKFTLGDNPISNPKYFPFDEDVCSFTQMYTFYDKKLELHTSSTNDFVLANDTKLDNLRQAITNTSGYQLNRSLTESLSSPRRFIRGMADTCQMLYVNIRSGEGYDPKEIQNTMRFKITNLYGPYEPHGSGNYSQKWKDVVQYAWKDDKYVELYEVMLREIVNIFIISDNNGTINGSELLKGKVFDYERKEGEKDESNDSTFSIILGFGVVVFSFISLKSRELYYYVLNLHNRLYSQMKALFNKIKAYFFSPNSS